MDCGLDTVRMAREKCIMGSTVFIVLPGGRNRQAHATLQESVIDVLMTVSLGYNGDTRKEWPEVLRKVREAFIKDIEATGFWWQSLLRLMTAWFQDSVGVSELDFSFFLVFLNLWCNRYIILCKVKVYSMLIWYVYISQYDYRYSLANSSSSSRNCHFFCVVSTFNI